MKSHRFQEPDMRCSLRVYRCTCHIQAWHRLPVFQTVLFVSPLVTKGFNLTKPHFKFRAKNIALDAFATRWAKY